MPVELTCRSCWVNQAPTKTGSLRECQGCPGNTVGGVSLSAAPASFIEIKPPDALPELVDVPNSPQVEAIQRKLARRREQDGARRVEQWNREQGY